MVNTKFHKRSHDHTFVVTMFILYPYKVGGFLISEEKWWGGTVSLNLNKNLICYISNWF